MTHGDWWGVNVLSKSELPALTVWDRQFLEDYERKDQLLNQSMSDGGDCRTAPATPGLLIINKESGKMESRGEKSVRFDLVKP